MVSKYYLLLLISLCSLSACTSGDENGTKPVKKKAIPEQHYNYAVYLENSGSLNGYLGVSGDNDFKSNVYGVISTISSLPTKKRLSIYNINTKIDTVAGNADATQVGDYFNSMTAASFKKRSEKTGGNQAKSDLGDIIKTVVDKTAADDVSLLISDCIFSPGKQGNAQDYLNQQESSIKALFGERLTHQAFSTLVLQFLSDFNGSYYYQDNSSKTGKFEKRPYYIVCFGPEQALAGLLQNAGRSGDKGFQDYLFLTPVKEYNVTPAIRDNSDYYAYDPESLMTITEPHKGGTDNHFRIVINVDYTQLPVGPSYLQDPANYTVTQGYALESVKKLQNETTHEITLVAARVQTGKVDIALKRQLPGWINTSNLSADKGLGADALQGKTFGIRYLLQGIYSAYAGYMQNPDYFHFTISVKD
jgi:hypothetical protein